MRLFSTTSEFAGGATKRTRKFAATSMIRGGFAALTFIAMLIASGCVGTTGKGAVGGGNGTNGTVAITVSPAALNFGNLAVGTGSMQTVTITNDGTASLSIAKLAVTGTGYTIGGLTAPTTIASGKSATLNVAFKATASGATTGVVTITSNADDSPTAVPLNGDGVSASLTLSPTSINFGSVSLGTTSTQSVKITNSGSASATISAASVSGTGVTLSGLTIPTTLNAGKSASVTATFKPTSTSSESGAISITSSASSSALTADWTGSGSASTLSVTPASVSFGSVTVGSDATQTIKLANSGSATITISKLTTSGTGMSASGLSIPYTLGAGKSATFTAQFKPTSASSVSGSIVLDSNASSTTSTIPLSGKGVASTVALTPSATSLSFGSVKVGSSATQSVTVTSSGNANVNIASVSVSGTGFSLSGSGGAVTLTPDQSAQYTVNFNPKASGNATGTLTITSNAPNSPLKISLSGSAPSASPSASHTVALKWDASSSSVVGYNVYRATKPSGPFSKLNSSPNSSTSYSDSSVTDGTEYYYVVTSVNSNNVESSDSNQVSATIPSN
jgi:hypothetical protein